MRTLRSGTGSSFKLYRARTARRGEARTGEGKEMYTASQHAIIFRPCVCSGTKRSTRESSQTYGYVCPKTKRRTKKSVRLGSGLVADTKTHCDLSSVCGRAGGQRARAPRTDTSYIPSLRSGQGSTAHCSPPTLQLETAAVL